MIYSERYLSDMERSLNCLILGETTFDNIFTLDICTKNIIDNKMINKSQLKVSHLKALIWNKKTHVGKFKVKDPDSLNLWKVDISEIDEDKLKYVSVEKDIEDKLGGKILRPGKFYSTYFPDDEKPTENVRIIVVLPLI
ncbi:hypothetical protein RclHR1_08190005 [Rhizophagus clarus]|uniref:Crinkler effector protein N-terminal domain-containing protein n=1 Tax=Rhizophagus clarus TaxID=94130 RepID=A0A2Z6SN13_9GLOM|nr:hypothetical protein RclHR1_08190005 [Rhizophagus clarus]